MIVAIAIVAGVVLSAATWLLAVARVAAIGDGRPQPEHRPQARPSPGSGAEMSPLSVSAPDPL